MAARKGSFYEAIIRDTQHPDMDADPEKWERSWVQDLKRRWSSTGRNKQNFATTLPPNATQIWCSERYLVDLQNMTSELLTLQTRLAHDVAGRVAWDNFEDSWRALTDERRRKIVLQGIIRAMKTWPGSHQERMLCPDSTVDNLTSKAGETYLEYLKLLTPVDPSNPPVEPRTIPHPAVDRFILVSPKNAGKPGYKGYSKFQQLMRARCLTRIVANIFGVFYEFPSAKQPESMTSERVRDAIELLEKKVQHMSLSDTKFEECILNIRKSLDRKLCQTCNKSEDKDHGVTLSCCPKCRAVGRKVLYCSRECQKKDWNYGRPRPHKQVCGRSLDEGVLDHPTKTQPATTSPPDKDLFPDPDSSFKRTPALLRQITELRRPDGVDYVLFAASHIPKERRLRCELPAPHRADFFSSRYDAFRVGHPPSVTRLFIYVCLMEGSSPDVATGIQTQMEAEYGVSLADVRSSLDRIQLD